MLGGNGSPDPIQSFLYVLLNVNFIKIYSYLSWFGLVNGNFRMLCLDIYTIVWKEIVQVFTHSHKHKISTFFMSKAPIQLNET